MSGHLLALGLGNSLLWSLYLLLTRHVVSGAALDAWAYTLVQLLFAGLIMLWLGRRAAGSWYELLAPWTVGYAFLRVAINGATAAAIVWLAITESTLLATVSVLIGAGSGWWLTRNAPAARLAGPCPAGDRHRGVCAGAGAPGMARAGAGRFARPWRSRRRG